MNYNETRKRAAALYDAIRDESRSVAEFHIQRELSAAYLTGYTSACEMARDELAKAMAPMDSASVLAFVVPKES